MNIIEFLLPNVARLRGGLYTASIDVFVPGGTPVIPDILVVLPDGAAGVVRRGIEGPPDLVVEVPCPSSRGHDLLARRALYGRAGVREYWVVDPEARTIEILVLDADALHRANVSSDQEAPHSPVLGLLPIPAAELFAGID